MSRLGSAFGRNWLRTLIELKVATVRAILFADKAIIANSRLDKGREKPRELESRSLPSNDMDSMDRQYAMMRRTCQA